MGSATIQSTQNIRLRRNSSFANSCKEVIRNLWTRYARSQTLASCFGFLNVLFDCFLLFSFVSFFTSVGSSSKCALDAGLGWQPSSLDRMRRMRRSQREFLRTILRPRCQISSIIRHWSNRRRLKGRAKMGTRFEKVSWHGD